jgi:cytochrome c-type biogenesis protein
VDRLHRANIVNAATEAGPRAGSELARSALFLALGIGLGLALIAGRQAVYQLQGGTSDAVSVLPFGYAFAAGMVAAVNPCGVLLLPSLVAYYLGGENQAETPWWERTSRAFALGAMATLGFVALFAVVGVAFALSGRALGAYFPVGGMAIGLGLTALGVWLAITDRSFGLTSAGRAMSGVRLESNLRSLFLFGLGYGVASLACTLPVFLVVVGTALGSGGLLQAAGQFVVYALGMGTVLTAVVVGAAFFRAAVTRVLRGALPYLHRLAASLLLGAGIYLIHYWMAALSF